MTTNRLMGQTPREEAKSLESTAGKKAAVLLLIYLLRGEPHLVFTKRTEGMPNHKGEISLPGGAHRAHDASLLDTALRETHEELGIEPGQIKILGQLDDIYTLTSGFTVSPFIGFTAARPQFRVDPSEVAEVIEVPLVALLDPAIFHEEERRLPEGSYKGYFYQYREHKIWGATARILKQFLDLYQAQPAIVGQAV